MSRKIGVIAARLGATVRTLRFYEEQGLVNPRRTPGGTRLYSAEDEARFAALLAFSRLGFSLKTLAGLAGIRADSATGEEASTRVRAQLEAMLTELKEQARAIARQQADLKQALDWVRRCQGCTKPPVRTVCAGCERARGWETSETLRIVWDEASHDESATP